MFPIGLLAGLLAILLLLLLAKHLLLKKQIRSLTRQLTSLVDGSTEKMLELALIDRDLERLAGTLNQYNAQQRYAVACARQHEDRLKASIANISHDLRTPLTVILGHLQLLQKSRLAPGQAVRVQTAQRKAERMKELVGAFYELSVLDSAQAMPNKERLNLTNLLLELLTENAPAFEGKGIQPQIALPEHSLFVRSDRDMLERIFQNLLTNALRYSADEVSITLTPSDAGRITFCIENRLPPHTTVDTTRLFERFYTGDQSRHSGSTGLGLAVVKLLVDKLDGQVTASASDEILSVTVRLQAEE